MQFHIVCRNFGLLTLTEVYFVLFCRKEIHSQEIK